MRQWIRLFLNPKAFFSQLQWSTHHWFIVGTFLIMATLETRFAETNELFFTLSFYVQHYLGIGNTFATWILMLSKLVVMLLGAYVVISFVWFLGNILGTRKSKRVLFRRLAIVFTVFLIGFTTSHVAPYYPSVILLSLFAYLWGFLLGFFAIREQFELNHVETLVVSSFAILLVVSTLHVTKHALETLVQNQEIAIIPNQNHK